MGVEHLERLALLALRSPCTADPCADVADLGLVRYLLLALTQEEDLIEQSGGQCRLIVDALTKDMPVHLHAAHQEVDITGPNSQSLGLHALATDRQHGGGQLELLCLQHLDANSITVEIAYVLPTTSGLPGVGAAHAIYVSLHHFDFSQTGPTNASFPVTVQEVGNNENYAPIILPRDGTSQTGSAAATCAEVLKDAVFRSTSPPPLKATRVSASFTPAKGLTTNAAAVTCGVQGFNWQQKFYNVEVPFPVEVGTPASHHSIQLRTGEFDPPADGYLYCLAPGPLSDPDGCNNYPFYRGLAIHGDYGIGRTYKGPFLQVFEDEPHQTAAHKQNLYFETTLVGFTGTPNCSGDIATCVYSHTTLVELKPANTFIWHSSVTGTVDVLSIPGRAGPALSGSVTLDSVNGRPVNDLVSVSLSSAVVPAGGPVIVTVSVSSTSGVPGGQVQVIDGDFSTPFTSLVNGAASFSLKPTTVGSHPLIALYSGDANNPPISGGTVLQVLVSGDVNRDGAVDCLDMVRLRASFGKRTGQTGFDPAADLNADGIVDINDLVIVSRQLAVGTVCR